MSKVKKIKYVGNICRPVLLEKACYKKLSRQLNKQFPALVSKYAPLLGRKNGIINVACLPSKYRKVLDTLNVIVS